MRVQIQAAAVSAVFILTLDAAFAGAGGFQTSEAPQLSGSTKASSNGWSATPLITVGEEGANGADVNLNEFGYRVPGLLDGTGVFPMAEGVLRVLVNHEFGSANGYAYQLANGTSLTGARVSYVDIDTCTRRALSAGLAYDTIYDRAGVIVTDAVQINEGFGSGGFNRFCAANGFHAGDYGLVNDCYFMGEEVGEGGTTPATGLGGQQVAIDVNAGAAYVVPMLGRGAWESSTFVENFGTDKVVVMWGDDRQGAPVWLYVGEKGAAPDSGSYSPPEFLKANGLGFGYLFAWKSNDRNDASPQEFNGTGSVRSGTFVRVNNFDPSLASTPNWDDLGFASQNSINAQAFAAGAFAFSRPEDVGTNPADGTQIAFASTGRGSLFPADNWGTIYVFDFDDEALMTQLAGPLGDINDIPCTVTIIYDGDDAGDQFDHPDFGIRSPDNLDWAADGYIYAQEDRSTSPDSLFGSVSGAEASVWRLDPKTSAAVRILEMDRTAVPAGQSDPAPSDLGNWESSGVLDVTAYFATEEGETVLLLDTQAHSLQSVAGVGLAKNAAQGADLVEGGQLFLASNASNGGDALCDSDFNCDGMTDAADLALFLGEWGSCEGCAADIDGDGTVGAADLAILLGGWGVCK